MSKATHDWYTIVSFGWGPYEPHPEGPWHGFEAADEALGRWCWRLGPDGGTAMAAHSVRVVGPFCSRRAAQQTSISDYESQVCTCEADHMASRRSAAAVATAENARLTILTTIREGGAVVDEEDVVLRMPGGDPTAWADHFLPQVGWRRVGEWRQKGWGSEERWTCVVEGAQ